MIQNIEETCGKTIVLFFYDVVNLRSMKTFLQECRFFKISIALLNHMEYLGVSDFLFLVFAPAFSSFHLRTIYLAFNIILSGSLICVLV